MTTGEYLDMVEADARTYRRGAIASLIRNGVRMYELSASDIRHLQDPARQRANQAFIDAVLADFINHLAAVRVGDRGERVEHLK